jgi:hypothetical protein
MKLEDKASLGGAAYTRSVRITGNGRGGGPGRDPGNPQPEQRRRQARQQGQGRRLDLQAQRHLPGGISRRVPSPQSQLRAGFFCVPVAGQGRWHGRAADAATPAAMAYGEAAPAASRVAG